MRHSLLGNYNHLSHMMALMCEPTGRMCSGGWAKTGFEFAMSRGVCLAKDWKYKTSCLPKENCSFGDTCMTAPVSRAPYQCTAAPRTNENLEPFFTIEEVLHIRT